MATHARQQYFADESSLSKEKREFSIAEEVQQKIDGIEEGAQVNTIETIKVNGSEVQPDENKAVDLTIPGVVDSLDSTSSTDALSAKQGKVLYDYIQDVSHIGHFLALWNASTGLPVTDPETSPYIYNTGDFYTVSVVAPEGGTNYKPDGTQYVIGQASTAVDTDNVAVNDFYFYDGQVWRHMKNSGAGSIAVDGSLSTTSTNPVENRVITNALNGKADSTDVNTKTFYISGTTGAQNIAVAQEAYDWYLVGKNPIISYLNSKFTLNSADSGSVEFLGPTVQSDGPYAGGIEVGERILRFILSNGQVTSISDRGLNNSINYISIMDPQDNAFIPTYDWQPASKKYVDDNAGVTYTAGANIQISNENVISATDTKYTAGTGISIDTNNVISNTQPGPVVSATAPSNPSEGDLWYDTTNDVLKSYDGTNWGEGSNVKAFFITNMGSSAAALAEAQPIYDWYIAGKEPIVIYRNTAYILRRYQSGTISFISSEIQTEQQSSISRLYYYIININYDGTGVVTSSGQSTLTKESILETNRDYSTPYTPQYNGSPATKKYVDDSISAISITPSWGDITGTLSDQTDLQNALNTKADATDINTKTFYLSSTSDLTTAQAAYDWYLAGKNPIIIYSNEVYVLSSIPSGKIVFLAHRTKTTLSDKTQSYYRNIQFILNSDTVTSIYINSTYYNEELFLETNRNYSTPYTPQYPGSPATKKYVDDNVKTYTAGTNVQISSSNVISATDTTYNAGEGIEIGNVSDYSAMRGPAPIGYHVPQNSEWVALCGILTSTFGMAANDTTAGTYLKMPLAGYRSSSSSNVLDAGRSGYYWSSTAGSSDRSYYLVFYSSALSPQTGAPRTRGMPVRCFKDNPVTPDSGWTTLYDGSSVATGAGVFRNSSLGLISVSGDGTTWYTIQDKNLGATTVYNQGDTLTDDNCGCFYQWGNNYGFPHSGDVTTSSTKVDASSYGPGNYYSSSTFITTSASPHDWSSVQNDNLWGGVTGVVQLDNAITNTGVLSVNGQTGDVTIPTAEESNTKTFYLSSTSDTTNAQAALDWYLAGKNPIIVYNDTSYITYNDLTSGTLTFRSLSSSRGNVEGYSYRTVGELTIRFNSSNVVTTITWGNTNFSGSYIATDFNYSTPYTPLYDGSPATKKYVDDNINTKTFYAAGQSDWNTTLGQSVYNWIKDGNYAILHYGVHDTVLFLPTNITTGTITSEAYNYGQAQSNQQTEISQTYSMVVSNGTVTSTDAAATVNGVGNFFAPGGTATTGYVVTKTATGYEWAAPSGGDVMVSSQANNILTSGMKIRAGTQANYEALSTYDSNTVYLTIE